MSSVGIESYREPGGDAWAWWQARRLRYNLALAAAGWAAYGANALVFLAAGRSVWRSVEGALGMTLFLGVLYLLLMGAANVCYLIGPLSERWLRPVDLTAYRRTSYALGLCGSVAVPFVFPLANLGLLLAGGD